MTIPRDPTKHLPVHPGQVLGEYLAERGLGAARLARDLGVAPELVEGLLAGRAALTAELAERLAARLGGEAGFWLALQGNFAAAGRTAAP